MSFSAIAQQPVDEPPRVHIEAGTDDPAKSFTSLEIFRDGKLIREQPFIGGSSAVVDDYESPFGVSVTYSAVGTMATFSSFFTEAWSSLSGWTTDSGTPSVSGSHLGGGGVRRPLVAPAEGRLDCQGLKRTGSFDEAGITLSSPAGLFLVVKNQLGPGFHWGESQKSVSGLDSPFNVVWDTNGATLTTVDGTWSIAGTPPASTTLLLQVVGSASFVEDFAITTPTNLPFNDSWTITPAFQGTWLIHPSSPSLSCRIDSGQTTNQALRFVEARSGESKTSRAVRTVHRPPGRRRAVVHTHGPREADDWTLVVGAPTISAKNDIRALIDDQTPLLLRSPADAGWDLPDGWYSVGDVDFNRLEKPVANQLVLIPLPLTPVDEPIVRQGALWTWGDVLLRYATWRELLADNPTWLDVLAG